MRIKQAHDAIDAANLNIGYEGPTALITAGIRRGKARRAFRAAEEALFAKVEGWLAQHFPEGFPEGVTLVSNKLQVNSRQHGFTIGGIETLRWTETVKGGVRHLNKAQQGFKFVYDPNDQQYLISGDDYELGIGNKRIEHLVMLEELVA